jgi:hypothetical protein
MPLVNRTRAIFLIAEFGFLGVLVVTFVHTPRLKGENDETGRFFRLLNVRVKATAFDLRLVWRRLRLMSWFMVGTVI